MSYIKNVALTLWCSVIVSSVLHCQDTTNTISLQKLLKGVQDHYELLKYQNSMVKADEAEVKAVVYQRLPKLNTMLEADLGSNNNLEGTYLTYGLLPSVTGGSRASNNLEPITGDVASAGINWEVTNFGAYKARKQVAQYALASQMNLLAKSQHDLNGIAASYYVELLRKYELEAVDRDNIARLQQLKTSVAALVNNGVRPGIDTAVATAALSKAMVQLYQTQKGIEQLQVQIATLSGYTATGIVADTAAVNKLLTDGLTYTLNAAVDSLHHPYINYYNAQYDLSRAKLNLTKNSYYPKLYLDATGWYRGSSLNNKDQFNLDLAAGFVPARFNYLTAITLRYDIFDILHKHLGTNEQRFETDASLHQLQFEKEHLQDAVAQAQIEKTFQLNKLRETNRQLNAASSAYQQQLGLYNSGLSSIIDLNTALNYYIDAERDYAGAKADLMQSIINYCLITNSFTGLVAALNL